MDDQTRAYLRSEAAPVPMFVPPSLPYYKHASLLPARLPTIAEISASTHELNRNLEHVIVVVRQQFVVKFGYGVRETEGHNLLFLERYTQIATPTLYAMYRNGDVIFLVMEIMAGQSLAEIWQGLQDADRIRIMQRLRTILDHIRSIPPPEPHFFGCVAGGSVPHNQFFTMDNDPAHSGPFHDEHAFNMAMVKQLRGAWRFKAEYYAKHLSETLKDHLAVFTHTDIQPNSIRVDGLGPNSDKLAEDFEVSIVGWDDAGWYPAYWEYSGAFRNFNWRNDWPNKLEIALDAWPAETASVNMICQDLMPA